MERTDFGPNPFTLLGAPQSFLPRYLHARRLKDKREQAADRAEPVRLLLTTEPPALNHKGAAQLTVSVSAAGSPNAP